MPKASVKIFLGEGGGDWCQGHVSSMAPVSGIKFRAAPKIAKEAHEVRL